MQKTRWILCVMFAGLLLSPAVMAQSEEAPGQQPPPPGQGGPGGFGGPRGGMMREPGGMKMRGPGPDLGKWWKDSEVARELGLSDQQINQAEAVFLDHRLKLIDMTADVQRNEARLQPLMEADQLDEAKISAQLDQLLAARSRLEKANMMMMISIRKVLTMDQWKKLENIREERMRTFMRAPRPGDQPGPNGQGGPGGMMKRRQGPPPPPDPLD